MLVSMVHAATFGYMLPTCAPIASRMAHAHSQTSTLRMGEPRGHCLFAAGSLKHSQGATPHAQRRCVVEGLGASALGGDSVWEPVHSAARQPLVERWR